MQNSANKDTSLLVVISHGIKEREHGNFESAKATLEKVFHQSLRLKEREPSIDAGNNLSITYRLIAGRYAREGNLVEAERYSSSSLRIYHKLEQHNFFDEQDLLTLRNKAHAFLYAGFFDEAITLLQQSASRQTTLATQGDEYCHLASAYLARGEVSLAEASLIKGLELLSKEQSATVALTYGMMTEATLFAKKNLITQATARLHEARKIAEKEQLAVRTEEIACMLGQESIDVVRAVSGDLPIVRSLTTEIRNTFVFPSIHPKHQLLLLPGGLQGSGKTTVLTLLKSKLGLVIFSGDEIRQRLFDQGMHVSKQFEQIVDATTNSLFRSMLRLGYSIAIDRNITSQKIESFLTILKEEGKQNYRVMTVYFAADKDTLVQRLRRREPLEGRYKGTIAELETSVLKEYNAESYDVIVDTTVHDPQMIANIITTKLYA